MKIALITALLLAAAPGAVLADETFHHPAIAVQEIQPAGYDYASKFYPHPAWFHLLAEAPREMGQHPAVLVYNRGQQEQSRQREERLVERLIASATPVAPETAVGP